jgi:NADH:ubiquinone oxidoreductase subunit C
MLHNFVEMAQKVEDAVGFEFDDGRPPVMYVPKGNLVRILTILHSHAELKFRHLIDILVVDHSECDPCFEVNYMLRSMHDHCQICVRTHVDEDETLDSIVAIYKSANWREREMAEMFGIRIRNQRHIRRLSTNAGTFPLRRNVHENRAGGRRS